MSGSGRNLFGSHTDNKITTPLLILNGVNIAELLQSLLGRILELENNLTTVNNTITTLNNNIITQNNAINLQDAKILTIYTNTLTNTAVLNSLRGL